MKSVIAIVKDNDYDGIDLDWEYPDTEKEVAGFERLVTAVSQGRSTTSGPPRAGRCFLTMAASSNPGTLKWLGKDFLLETMDWINVMTYDYTGDWTNFAGHHSPLFRVVQAARRPAVDGAHDEIPARGTRHARQPAGGGHPTLRPWLRRVASLMHRPKAHPRPASRAATTTICTGSSTRRAGRAVWDSETQNPWLIAPDHKVVIGYDDAESVALKTEWAMKQGFRGVFFWQIGADLMPDDTNPLQEASRAKLRRRRAEKPRLK